MKVIKSNGKSERFNPKKLRRSLLRSGVSLTVIDEILSHLHPQLYDGISTKKIFQIVRRELKKQDICAQCRYSLRAALLRLGPAGYNFEKYIASILQSYDYDAHLPPQEIKGACVYHEVDVIAKKDNSIIFIEAKFRNRFGDDVDLKDVMASYARYLDLKEGSKISFNQGWIMTNARFSDRAQAFGLCKGMKLVGWSFPKEGSLGNLVDHAGLYPVTVLALKKMEIEALATQGIMLCKELVQQNPRHLAKLLHRSEQSAKDLLSLCEKLVSPSISLG